MSCCWYTASTVNQVWVLNMSTSNTKLLRPPLSVLPSTTIIHSTTPLNNQWITINFYWILQGKPSHSYGIILSLRWHDQLLPITYVVRHMYVNSASSFTYISVIVQFTFIFLLQVICASIYALPFKLLWLGTVAQLCLWLLYTRIILPTLLNKIKELTHVGTYNCVVCTTNTCQPIFQKQICLC